MYCARPSNGLPGRCWPGARPNSRRSLAGSPVEGLARWPLLVRSGGAAAQGAPLLLPPLPSLPPPNLTTVDDIAMGGGELPGACHPSVAGSGLLTVRGALRAKLPNAAPPLFHPRFSF